MTENARTFSILIGEDEFVSPAGTTREEAQAVIDDAIAIVCEERYRDGHPRPMRDEHGHFPGCYAMGCRATRCRDMLLALGLSLPHDHIGDMFEDGDRAAERRHKRRDDDSGIGL